MAVLLKIKVERIMKQNEDNPSKMQVKTFTLNNMRNLRRGKIPLEVDLENGDILISEEVKEMLNLNSLTKKIDEAIETFVAPSDTIQVKNSLVLAQKGTEEPISFNFIHPKSMRKLYFEYKYEIVYVKYASTRLKGVLEFKAMGSS
jgi:hypothetical protein